jgi:hypothetical protein
MFRPSLLLLEIQPKSFEHFPALKVLFSHSYAIWTIIDYTNFTESKVQYMNDYVQLRLVPYPYKAMLAICSDLDETPDKHVYREIMRFLNTTEETAMGPGAGLEVGNSIYFDMPREQFSYWNTDNAGREMVRKLIQSGHIDCLHSYGDLATKREHAAKALDELDRYGCKLEVWIDHGKSPTNFGPDIMQGHGDQPGHQAYHADLTIDYGIKYIWKGRVTSITGQDVPASLAGIFVWEHPLNSLQTLLKEAFKIKFARLGNKKYLMHSPNETLRQTVLRDGREVYEFMRCNPHWGGISSCDQGRHIAQVLTEKMLNRLIMRGGMCILYTHLGKIDNPEVPFNQDTVNTFYRLAQAHRQGEILVTTTRRLLGYLCALREVTLDSSMDNEGLCIGINTLARENAFRQLCDADLSGVTIYVSDFNNVRIKINGKKISNIQQNLPDYTGRPSVSLKWPVLEFPEI